MAHLLKQNKSPLPTELSIVEQYSSPQKDSMKSPNYSIFDTLVAGVGRSGNKIKKAYVHRQRTTSEFNWSPDARF